MKSVSVANPVDGISDATVLKAGTMLHYAQALKSIGTEYYEAQKIKSQEGQYRKRMQAALDRTNGIKKELMNARQRLDYEGFEKELSLLENYLTILGKELDLGEDAIGEIVRDKDLDAVSRDRSVLEHMDNLFQEIQLDMRSRKPGNIAVSGFSFPDGHGAKILALLDETGQAILFQLAGFTIVERQRLDAVLKEQELALSELMETEQAIKVGKILSAIYILTGTVVEMSKSVVVFGRIVNVETAALESVGQVIVPRNDEVNALLAH